MISLRYWIDICQFWHKVYKFSGLPCRKNRTIRVEILSYFLSRISIVVLTEFSISWRHEVGSFSVAQNSRAQLEIRRANIHGWCLRFSPGGRPSMQISKAARSQYSAHFPSNLWLWTDKVLDLLHVGRPLPICGSLLHPLLDLNSGTFFFITTFKLVIFGELLLEDVEIIYPFGPTINLG